MDQIKKLILPIIFFIFYWILIITVFFGWSDITEIWATIGLQIVIMIIGFLAIQSLQLSQQKATYRTITIIWSTLTLISVFTHSIQNSIFLLCTHIIFLIYARNWFILIASSKKYYLRRASHRWLDTISLMLALTYTATLRSAWTTIQIDCNDLQHQTIWVITRYIPNLQNNTGFNSFIAKIESIWSQKVWQLLWTASLGSWEIISTIWQNNSWNYIISTSITGNILSWDTTWTQQWLISSLLWYQQNLLNGIIDNQELIDTQVCDLTLQHINDIIKQSDVQLIAFVLLVLLISVFMRSIMFIVGIINFILIRLLIKIHRFTKKTYTEEVETLE